MEAPELEAEITQLKQKISELEREIAQLKTAGFVTLKELRKLVPAIVIDHQRRRG